MSIYNLPSIRSGILNMNIDNNDISNLNNV